MRLLVGIFIGGRGARMGTLAKGLLPAPHTEQNLLERLRSIAALALPEAELVLVGQHSAYTAIALPQLPDASHRPGPLGGLLALCRSAEVKGYSDAIALACDMPYLEAPLLTRLARHAVGAQAVAPVVDQRWQPFFARYRADRTRAAIEAEAPSSRGSLQSVLTRLGAELLPLTPDEIQQLRDWDAPGDMV